uniref:Uncharacterized protein n=1 Tax=Ixodes ricinus TaxID=34613 RepID=A0A6B0UD83_IXORI
MYMMCSFILSSKPRFLFTHFFLTLIGRTGAWYCWEQYLWEQRRPWSFRFVYICCTFLSRTAFLNAFFMVLLSVNAVYILVAGFYAVIRLYIL